MAILCSLNSLTDDPWVRVAFILSLAAALTAQAMVPGMAEEEPKIPDWINE
jgi:hypothetical protein